MANAVITMRMMPSGPDVDLGAIEETVKQKISTFTSDDGEMRFELTPVAFGLKALNVTFLMNEDLGSPEDLEKDLATIEGVQSVETTDVRRALG